MLVYYFIWERLYQFEQVFFSFSSENWQIFRAVYLSCLVRLLKWDSSLALHFFGIFWFLNTVFWHLEFEFNVPASHEPVLSSKLLPGQLEYFLDAFLQRLPRWQKKKMPGIFVPEIFDKATLWRLFKHKLKLENWASLQTVI